MKANRHPGRTSFPPIGYRKILVIALCLCIVGCGARHTPNLERIFAPARERKNKRPIIVIPGTLGSQLVNKRRSEIIWYGGSSVDDLALPISPDLAKNTDDLVVGKIIDSVKIARLRFNVYNELLVALKNYGDYREGDWNAPTPDGDRDTFYVFPYDWRRDNVETARELIRRMDELKRKLNSPDLRFNILAHSMGGLIARYAAMYGDADLPPENIKPQVTWAGARDINKIFMFGTPNEGSMEALTTLIDGYSITEGLRRRLHLFRSLSRENVLTMPSVYQLLPFAEAENFLDENLQPLKVDLYDPATWKKYNWGAISDETFRARFPKSDALTSTPAPASKPASIETNAPVRKPTLEDLDSFFAAALRRANRFHQTLDVEINDHAPVAMYAFGGDCEETLSAPVILRDMKNGGYITLTQPRSFQNGAGRKFSRADLIKKMYEPGDGRVTRRSLLGGNFRGDLPFVYTVFACDLHSELQNNKSLQDNALTQLIGEVMK